MHDKKAYYLSLEYEIIIKRVLPQDGGGYFAYYKDFKGVMGDGESADSAIQDAQEAFGTYLDIVLSEQETIPEPSHLSKSKRINITLPISLLNKIDAYVEQNHTNRSSFFRESALQVIED
jgi:predicted RNase H-like HicB family nuclease